MKAVAFKQLRYVLSVTSGATPDSGKSEYWDGDIRWITPEDVSTIDGYWITETRRKITREGYNSCGTSLVPRGSIVLTKRAPIGQLAILAEPACSNQGCFLLTPRGAQDSRYYYYWLATQADRLQVLGRGSTFMELSTDELKALHVPEPPLPQQRAIADYLDRETARIDALIGAKERLLALLAEKRRALITRAVTSGLDPHAPMRDSGIPWLGEIPAHWGVVRLRFLTRLIEQGWSPQAENREPSMEEWGVLKVNAVNQGRFDDTAAKALPLSADPKVELEVRRGDFLVTRSNTPSLVGDACFVEATRPRLMLCDLVYRLHLDEKCVDGRFLGYFITLPIGRHQIEAEARGTSASMVKISQEHIKDWVVPLPPPAEQRAIVDHITEETARLDALRAATERSIALLKERRAALISAAVTGQIDAPACAAGTADREAVP